MTLECIILITSDSVPRRAARKRSRRASAEVSRTQEQRIVGLHEILATADVIEADAMAADQMRFGVTVAMHAASGEKTRYCIVGRMKRTSSGVW